MLIKFVLNTLLYHHTYIYIVYLFYEHPPCLRRYSVTNALHLNFILFDTHTIYNYICNTHFGIFFIPMWDTRPKCHFSTFYGLERSL